MNSILVYLPCYNEEENIVPLIENWQSEREKLSKKGYQLKIMPIDDKSKDSTLKLMKNQAEKYDNIRVIQHETNKNLGGGINTAVNDFLATSQIGDFMVLMDGDNTHNPCYVHDMLALNPNENNCIIASRYVKGAEIKGVSPFRLFLSDGAKFYYTLMLQVPNVKDYTCGYRLYGREALVKAKNKYKENLITRSSFSCMMELLYKLHKSGCKFMEVGFFLRYDLKQGESKMRVITVMKDSLITAFKLRFLGN